MASQERGNALGIYSRDQVTSQTHETYNPALENASSHQHVSSVYEYCKAYSQTVELHLMHLESL